MSVSDKRLAEIVAYVDLMGPNSEPCVPGDVARSMARELQSLRAAAKVRAIREGDGEWQPIETAPKDGERFLAYSERNQRHDILFWRVTDDEYADHFESALGYGGIPVPFLTSWCPLPAASPAATGGEKDADVIIASARKVVAANESYLNSWGGKEPPEDALTEAIEELKGALLMASSPLHEDADNA